MKKNVVIMGAGISGISLGKMLSGCCDVVLLEKQAKIGGLIKCERIDGTLFHRVGGHVFNSRNQEVLDWFWSHFDRDAEFIKARRNAKVWLGNRLIGYPIENHLYQLPANEAAGVINELTGMLQQQDSAHAAPANFEDFLVRNFGRRLYDLYFGPYNSKLWPTDLSKVPLAWLEGKLPMPEIGEILLSNILRKEESALVHATFYYPKEKGSQFIVDRLSQGQEIKLGYVTTSITVSPAGEVLLNDGDLCTDALVYCGDVRRLASLIGIDDVQLTGALAAVNSLISNGTSNVLCETDETDISWLYLPEPRFKAHRIIYTGNFSDTNNGAATGAGRKTCVVEFSGQVNQEEMIAELERLPGNLRAIAFNYEPDSYVIQHEDTRQKIDHLKQQLAKYSIYLLGRFAEWEYFNMDKCMESAISLKNVLLNRLNA